MTKTHSIFHDAAAQAILARLTTANHTFATRYPGEGGTRQPVSVLYGGAHLFKADTPHKLGAMALRSWQSYAPDVPAFACVFALNESLAEQVYARVQDKLTREPIEDLRIDFEDGYGFRHDDEEDAHAVQAAEQAAQAQLANTLPPFFGLRIKPLNAELQRRSLRTLELFLATLCARSDLPANFVITLPKVVIPEQVAALAELCGLLETHLGLAAGALRLELMVETPQAICNERGEVPLSKMITAANGRCRGVHFGAFDYTAACGITASHQDIRHPACDFARAMMQAAVAGTGVWLADGVTTTLPLELHRGAELSAAQRQENQTVIHRAWRLHFDNIQHSLRSGFYQSWDLHPAQLPARYAATYAFFLAGLDAATIRLRNFLAKAAQATAVGDVFDDVATGQGLLNYFLRAVHCGAVAETEVEALTGLLLAALQTASFAKILAQQEKGTDSHAESKL